MEFTSTKCFGDRPRAVVWVRGCCSHGVVVRLAWGFVANDTGICRPRTGQELDDGALTWVADMLGKPRWCISVLRRDSAVVLPCPEVPSVTVEAF